MLLYHRISEKVKNFRKQRSTQFSSFQPCWPFFRFQFFLWNYRASRIIRDVINGENGILDVLSWISSDLNIAGQINSDWIVFNQEEYCSYVSFINLILHTKAHRFLQEKIEIENQIISFYNKMQYLIKVRLVQFLQMHLSP